MAKRKFSCPCTFGSLSVGKESEGITVSIDRSRIDLETANDFFVNKQLEVKLSLGDPEQKTLPGVEKTEIEATVECRSFSVKDKTLSTRMKFVKDTAPGLRQLVAVEGVLTITKVKNAPEPEPEE